MHLVAEYIATFFKSGRLPKAPGTWGSLAAIVPLVFLNTHSVIYAIITVAIFGVGVWASTVVVKSTQTKDPGFVVIDEVCGMFVTFLWIELNVMSVIIGFALFRLFDIFKPYPIKRLEQFPEGYGIMLDDVMAGIYANVLLRAVLYYGQM